jgi:hypothetical protein
MNKINLNEAKETCDKIIEAVAAVFVGNKPLLKNYWPRGFNGLLFETTDWENTVAKYCRVIGCK